MLLPNKIYKKAGVNPTSPLIQMSDFNSLIALSQKYKAPVFALSDKQLEQTGVVLARTKKSMQQFYEIFSMGADRLIALIDNE